MYTFDFPAKNKGVILALGAESAGNFSVYIKGKIYFSQDFGDLLEEENFSKFKKAVLDFLKKEKTRPDVILTDLHPLMKTTLWGEELAKKFKAEFIQVQHHEAHIFSAIGDYLLPLYSGGDVRYSGQRGFRTTPNTFYAIAMDGTGLGTDEKIWGGEVFKVTSNPLPLYSGGDVRYSGQRGFRTSSKIERIGHLENQILLGGEIAIREPARVLLAILDKILAPSPVIRGGLGRGCGRTGDDGNIEECKRKIYPFIKKYYSRNEFELLHNQLQQNFNCAETSSTGRVLDAVSVLLGFSKNERKEKHGPTYALEKNSTIPYLDLKPKITQDATGQYILDTNYVINYVINYVHKKDKKRLAATVQHYLAEGLYEIISKKKTESDSGTSESDSVFSGGLAQNKIISSFLESQNAYAAKTIPPGDAGLSFGQVAWQLLR